jgi:hypothetical protein
LPYPACQCRVLGGIKKARAPSPQDGNNLWTGAHPRAVRICLGLPSQVQPLGELPLMESTLGAANRGPLRGGRRAAVLEAGRPAQAGRPAAGFARASPFGRWRFHPALSGCPPCPRWVRTWRESARARRPLQPSGPRAHDRRCASHLDWGSASPYDDVSRFVAAHIREELLCGESRSGPDPMRVDWPGLTREGGAEVQTSASPAQGRSPGHPAMSGGACSVRMLSGGHSESTGARLEGDLGAGHRGSNRSDGCAHGSSNTTIAEIGGAPLHRAQAC